MNHHPPETPHVLHLQDIYQGYGGPIVLDDIDLSVSPGEFLTVVGPSGCGKSTLLRLVIGQERPLSGVLLLDGKTIERPSMKGGVVYQNYSLFPHLTVLENVLVGHRLRVFPWQWASRRKEVVEEASHFLKKAGLIEHLGKYPRQLSGGQQQRVAIVQALMQQPRILCMDEPFSALDPGTRESMQMFLLELWEESKEMTLLFVTHDLEEGIYLGTRIVALSQYYLDDRGEGPNVKRGAKIAFDRKLRNRGSAPAPSIKSGAEFGELIQTIRRVAFDPSYRQHVEEFSLTHDDSWRTLQPEVSHIEK